jgi:hypothetical protein
MAIFIPSPVWTVPNGETAGVQVTEAGLVLQFFFNTEPIVPTLVPPGYGAGAPAATSTGAGAAFQVFYREAAGAAIYYPVAAPIEPGIGEAYVYVGMELANASVVAFPAAPLPQVLRLGCAETYEVFITGNNPNTLEPEIIDAVGWENLEWSRVEDDVSTASITLPDQYGGLRCMVKYGGLRPWRHGIRIERDGVLVWQGPVTTISRPTGSSGRLPELRVTASDLFARYMKRLATQDYTFSVTNEDAGSFFRRIAADTAIIPGRHNGFNLPIPTFAAGTSISREVVYRDFEFAWDVLKGLFDSAVDGYIMNNVAYFFEPGTGWIYTDGREPHLVLPGPYDQATGELVYGLFSNSAFIEWPGWAVSGWTQGNVGYIVGADTGEEGARRYWSAYDSDSWDLDGVLDFVDTNTLYRSGEEDSSIPDSAYQRRVDSSVALRANAPATIEGGVLSQQAPIDVDNLRPGSIWRMDVQDAGFQQLLQLARLKRVTVNVRRDAGGLSETVAPSLQPLGYTEADL